MPFPMFEVSPDPQLRQRVAWPWSALFAGFKVQGLGERGGWVVAFRSTPGSRTLCTFSGNSLGPRIAASMLLGLQGACRFRAFQG